MNPPDGHDQVRERDLPDHVRENKASWEVEAANYVEPARRNWATAEISWGMYNVREADVGALPDVAGMDVVELGCGTAYFSAWLARRGARPTGIDITAEWARQWPALEIWVARKR